jgi:branched-chain amino acid transport system permease protein
VSEAVQAVLLGVLAGGVYGLFAVGLSLSFGVLRIVNFAHGDFVMVGMYFAFVVGESTKLPLSVIALLAIIPASLLAWLVYVLFFARSRLAADSHDQLVVTLGLSILLENGVQDYYGATARSLNPDAAPQAWHFGSDYLPIPQFQAFLVSVVLVLVFAYVLRRTRFGREVRAVVADRRIAELLGIRAGRVFVLTFVASIVTAIIAGVFILGYLPATPDAGSEFILIGFMAVILGGIGDLWGTFAAAIIIGVAQSLVASYWAPNVEDVAAFALFIVVALTRPKGLFSRAVTR